MRILGVLVFGIALGVAGCSSSSDAPMAAGGAAGAAGSGGAAAHVPSQAAIKLNLGPPALQIGTSCPSGVTSYELGSPGPSETNPGTSIVDGAAGAVISCSVTGSGTGPFKFSASIHGTTATGDPITFVLSDGSVDLADMGSTTVSLFTPQLASTLTSGMPCQVAVVNEQVKGGSLWAEFACGEITSEPSADCAINGYFVLENCDGS